MHEQFFSLSTDWISRNWMFCWIIFYVNNLVITCHFLIQPFRFQFFFFCLRKRLDRSQRVKALSHKMQLIHNVIDHINVLFEQVFLSLCTNIMFTLDSWKWKFWCKWKKSKQQKHTEKYRNLTHKCAMIYESRWFSHCLVRFLFWMTTPKKKLMCFIILHKEAYYLPNTYMHTSIHPSNRI